MLNIGLLLANLDPAQRAEDLTTGDERLEEISQLSVDGEYLQAADRCQQLLESRRYDARLIGQFLFGVFLEQGIQVLPQLLGAVHRCLGPNLAALGPQHKREVLLDSSLQWLFTSLLKQIERSEQLHDAAWQALVEVKNLESVKKMLAELTEISGLAAKLVKRPRSVQPITHLEQVLKQAHTAIETSAESMRLSALSQMSAGARKPEKPRKPEPPEASGEQEEPDEDESGRRFDTSEHEARDEDEGEGEGEGEGDDARDGAADEDAGAGAEEEDAAAAHGGEDEAEEERAGAAADTADADEERPRARPEPPRKPAARAPAPARKAGSGREPQAERLSVRVKDGQGGSITIEGSPALMQLVRRIQAFQTLCKRGELRKAAVVADSVLTTLDAFDPRVFFPSLFLPFFSLLSENAEEIEQAMIERDSLTFKSLQQLMQVDIDSLLK
ncbi:MAG: type VI secretion system protein IglI family protein [Polyangia bacterium]